MEDLAYVEHEQWCHWMRYLVPKLMGEVSDALIGIDGLEDDVSADIFDRLNSLPCLKHWERQMETKYNDLTENEKESDRKEVRKKLQYYRA
jgi:hypothetical protein